ncbi:hypothetical protein LCM20_18505 [Halobacillus litoralis]|uniref:hypothetical protein n=1 Tax=Halobacillus litoralis TaxID=45668 RepID=UPI001CD753A2|nr:hypothetical protein [Halobacillus litoralis]MCA0972594.1 hypothetical protein [Halobacillus litoralis]
MLHFKSDKHVFTYLAAILSGFALILLSDEVLGEFFSTLFFYVGVIAVAFFSFVIIIFSFFHFFTKS